MLDQDCGLHTDVAFHI